MKTICAIYWSARLIPVLPIRFRRNDDILLFYHSSHHILLNGVNDVLV